MSQPFKAKKSLGQNFLTNPKIAEKIAKSAGIVAGETVLEIGPGTGMLTRALLAEGACILAVEADVRAIEVLQESFASEIAEKRLTLLHADIRTTELRDLPLPPTYKVAANIPYYLSGYLFEKMLESDRQPSTVVFLVQKEVAERIVRNKKESILSLSVKAYGIPSYVGTVSRGNFSPAPNVDSAILNISQISKRHFVLPGRDSKSSDTRRRAARTRDSGNAGSIPAIQTVSGLSTEVGEGFGRALDEKFFFTVLKTGFKARRKHLLGNLSELISREHLAEIFSTLAISPKARGEDLPIETWLSLARHLQQKTASL